MKKMKPNSVSFKLIHNINKFKRLHGYYPKAVDIDLEELAQLREELGIDIESELKEFNGIYLNVLHEETC